MNLKKESIQVGPEYPKTHNSLSPRELSILRAWRCPLGVLHPRPGFLPSLPGARSHSHIFHLGLKGLLAKGKHLSRTRKLLLKRQKDHFLYPPIEYSSLGLNSVISPSIKHCILEAASSLLKQTPNGQSISCCHPLVQSLY